MQIIGLVEAQQTLETEIIAKNHILVRAKAGFDQYAKFKIINTTLACWPLDSTIENDSNSRLI